MRLIDADLLKAKVPNTNVDIFENCRNCRTLMDWEVKELIDKMPTVDAVEVVHGEWEYNPRDAIEMMFTLPKCSICGHESADALNYCPNCGAKMDGERKKDE